MSIEVERGKLVISGERRTPAEGEAVLVRELRYGAFRREFALPQGVSPEQVEASYDGGLLDVRVRTAVPQAPTAVRVPITTSSRVQRRATRRCSRPRPSPRASPPSGESPARPGRAGARHRPDRSRRRRRAVTEAHADVRRGRTLGP